MFIPTIWLHEVERIGKQRCTPVGYVVHRVGDFIGYFGFLLLLGVPIYLAHTQVIGTFRWSLLWLLTVPFVTAIAGSLVVEFSWSFAKRKQFHFDRKQCAASWVEAGTTVTFTLADWREGIQQQVHSK